MCGVMFNPSRLFANRIDRKSEPGGNAAGKILNQSRIPQSVDNKTGTRPAANGEQSFACEIGFRVSGDREEIDVGRTGFCHLQTAPDRFGGKTGKVFQPSKPLLLDCSDETAVFY